MAQSNFSAQLADKLLRQHQTGAEELLRIVANVAKVKAKWASSGFDRLRSPMLRSVPLRFLRSSPTGHGCPNRRTDSTQTHMDVIHASCMEILMSKIL